MHASEQDSSQQDPHHPASGLAATLLPVLLHKLNNATQYVTGLSTLLSLVSGADGRDAGEVSPAGDVTLPGGDPSHGLADASQRVDDLGWALAVVATAEGADLVLERREPRGIDVFLWLLAEAFGKRGVRLRPRASGWHTDLHTFDGWQVPWGIATLLHGSAAPLLGVAPDLDAEPRDFLWSHEAGRDGGLVIGAPAPAAHVLDDVRTRLPGAAVEVTGGRVTLALPPAWARPAPAQSSAATPEA